MQRERSRFKGSAPNPRNLYREISFPRYKYSCLIFLARSKEEYRRIGHRQWERLASESRRGLRYVEPPQWKFLLYHWPYLTFPTASSAVLCHKPTSGVETNRNSFHRLRPTPFNFQTRTTGHRTTTRAKLPRRYRHAFFQFPFSPLPFFFHFSSERNKK